MAGHLTENILESIRTNSLPAHELMAVDDHLASCLGCRDMIGSSLLTAGAARRLEQAVTPEPDHLTYDEMEAYVDGHVSIDQREAVNRHIEGCTECSAELRDLRDFAARPATPTPVPLKAGWLSSVGTFFMRPVPAIASIALLLLVGLQLWHISDRDEVAVAPETVPAPEQSAAPVATPASEEAASATTKERTEELAVSIRDGGQTVGITKGGELVGYSALSPRYRGLLTRAIRESRLSLPNIDDLKNSAGVLMGDGSGGSFRVHSPVGKVIATNAPAFVWQGVPGAETYVVEVFDERFNKVASSGELKTTSWKRRLARGRTYTWQVTASTGENILKAPQRPQPDARFRIIDGSTSNALATLKRHHPTSHLLLGTAYANAGLIDDAVREFEMLSRQNPNSELPRKLLRQLRQ